MYSGNQFLSKASALLPIHRLFGASNLFLDTDHISSVGREINSYGLLLNNVCRSFGYTVVSMTEDLLNLN